MIIVHAILQFYFKGGKEQVANFLKITLISLLLALPTMAQKGDWSFVYYESAPTLDGQMPPPPLFDYISLREDGKGTVGMKLKGRAETILYKVKKDVLSFDIPMEDGKPPIHFVTKFTEKKGTLLLTGKNSKIVFMKSEGLIVDESLVGSYDGGTPQFPEVMEITSDGVLRMEKSHLMGYYRLWKNTDGVLCLTMLAGMPNSKWHTFLWQLRRNGKTLTMTPVTQKGPSAKHSSVWTKRETPANPEPTAEKGE